ncbi:glycosyltransferase [Lacisediminihabitans sp.]|uniref:glycosyltransferase n=1 Tax=Lacisediminihabitans sp. TaxID=2787631 RepID=UPI002F91EEBD
MRLSLRRASRWVRRAARAVRFETVAFWRSRPILPGTVLYESFAGNGALCNPEAIFRELLQATDQVHLRHIWVLDGTDRHRRIRHEFAADDRVSFVEYRSAAYFKALSTSQYLINNATFPPEFSKRAGQVYLNTWHGTPLKKMGYDMPNGAFDSANTLRNFVQADFLLAQNSFMAERMYAGAYRLKGLYRGTIIEEGYPRLDRQVLNQDQFLAGRARLASDGIDLGNRSIVLFAPTWKGDSFSSPADDVQELVDFVADLQARLGEDRYTVLLKTHQVVHQFARNDPRLRRILVSNEIPTNVVLGLSGSLITDYSSIFFDFLATGRPIVFYTPDMTDYSSTRGTYYPPAEWPGPLCSTPEEVAAAIAGLASDDAGRPGPPEPYGAWRERFTAHDDGNASRRVVDIVFRGLRDGYNLTSIEQNPRTSILLHLGGMRSNGITTSALNLLGAIDHDRFDVSAVFARPRGEQQRENQARIDPRVRQFPRLGGMNGSKILHLRRRMAERLRTAVHRSTSGQNKLWDDEWMRCFGDSRFDVVADFSGYTSFWATLLLHAPKARRSIWLHNDMAAETHRVIRGRKRMQHSLPAVFDLYREFDSLVSVSASLSDVNRRHLASFGIDDKKFTSARNLLDAEHVLSGAGRDLRTLADFPRDPDTDAVLVPEWVDGLLADDGTKWFITVGRYSTEKNQDRLLRAFAIVHAAHPLARLLLVGYGPLRHHLERQIHHLGLRGAAWVTGPYSNPFPIMAAADCFVLSSNYEGQPMVILEAAILGLPVVSVDFDSVRDALPNRSVHVVAMDDEALAVGMFDYLRGEVPHATIDIGSYNRAAVDEFYRATGSSVERGAAQR